MQAKENRMHPCALALISTPKLAERAIGLFQKERVPVQYEWNAVGTASGEMIDLLGLGTPDKKVLLSIMPRAFAGDILKKCKRELKLGRVDSGIAFTIPLTAANNLLVRMMEQVHRDETNQTERKGSVMADMKYSLVAAVVDQGYSENVMEAARAAGARGGTVVHSRSIADEQAVGFLGMSMQEEKDMVFIVTDNEHKLQIMQAIGEKCGMHSEAKGTVVSLPIDSVIGIADSEE